jgi:hypothetical protein
MTAVDLPPLGARVHITWASSTGGGSADGHVAARWACGACHTIGYHNDLAERTAIEDAGLTCPHVVIVRIRTDDGRDVMAHRADPRVLVIPITEGA